VLPGADKDAVPKAEAEKDVIANCIKILISA
jgi:hypothetical protein